MKKFYTVVMVAFAITSVQHSYAQCTLSDILIQNNYSLPVTAPGKPDSCDINFDIRFSSDNNNGNKRIFIHLWTTANYPNLTYSGTPTAAQLANSLGTIHIENPGATATLENSYVSGAAYTPVKILYTGLTLQVNAAPNPDQYTIHNVTLRVPGPCGEKMIKGDIWSSQNNANNPSCFTPGFQFVINNPIGVLEINCFTPGIPNDPQTYDLTITTSSTPPGLTISYTLWIDNGDNVFDAGSDIQVGGTNGPYNISSTTPKTVIDQPYLLQSNPNFNIYKDRVLWAVVTVSGFPNLILSKAPNGCAILPVKLSSFAAARKGRDVTIEWQTVQEVNNEGFTIEKVNQNGTVETIANIPTQAPNGNSSAVINYKFIHLNPSTASTQYRLKQTGRNGNIEYSDIRLVNGIDGFKGVNIYPNPTSSKWFNVYFDEAAGEKMVSLIDNTGRVVKQLTVKNASQTQITVAVPGVYHVSVLMVGTGERIVQKIVVNN